MCLLVSKNCFIGVPIMVQRYLWHLGSTGTQGPSLAKPSGLSIPCCHSCSVSCNCGSDSIPGLGTSICLESGWEKKKKQFQYILWFMDMSHSYTSSAGEKRQFWKTKKTVQLGFSKSRFWSFCQYVLFCYDSWHSVIIFQAPTIPGHQGHSILLCASLFLMC